MLPLDSIFGLQENFEVTRSWLSRDTRQHFGKICFLQEKLLLVGATSFPNHQKYLNVIIDSYRALKYNLK